jgi:hypothetical protein
MRPDRFPKVNNSVRDELLILATTVTAISVTAFVVQRFKAAKKACEELRWINMRLEAKVSDLSYGRPSGGKMAP